VGIVGAGYLGRTLVESLRRAVPGRQIVATTRSGRWRGEAIEHVAIKRLDLVDDSYEYARELLNGCTTLVACYAPGRGSSRELYRIGAQKLAKLCGALRVRRLVYTSSTSALPHVDGPVDENCDVWPSSERGIMQRQAEQLVIDTCTRMGVPWIVLRLAGLYGPGREPGSRFEPGEVLPGDGMEVANLVHLDDAVAATLAAIDLDANVSAIVHVCMPAHPSRRELYERWAAFRGQAAPRWELAPTAEISRGKRVVSANLAAMLELTLAHADPWPT